MLSMACSQVRDLIASCRRFHSIAEIAELDMTLARASPWGASPWTADLTSASLMPWVTECCRSAHYCSWLYAVSRYLHAALPSTNTLHGISQWHNNSLLFHRAATN